MAYSQSPTRYSGRVPRGRLERNLERLNGSGRISGVDLARGTAVLGMFAAHLLATGEPWAWDEPATWLAVVDGRSSILFATLAGVSIGLVTGGRTPLPKGPMGLARGRLALRAATLLVLGILLILTEVPVYVILPAYAILFLLALPFTRLPARVLLPIAGVFAVVMPFVLVRLNDLPLWQSRFGGEAADVLGWHYPFPVWIAFVLAGLGLARSGITRLSVQFWMLLGGVLLACAGYALTVVPAPPGRDWADVWTAEPHSSGVPEAIGSGGFAIAAIAVCLLLCRLGSVRMLTLPLRATGAMPLTAYTAQLLVWALVASVALGDASDFFGFRAFEPFWPLTIGIVVGCTAWALLIGRGPLEWALDRLAKVIAPDERAPVIAPDERAPNSRLDG